MYAIIRMALREYAARCQARMRGRSEARHRLTADSARRLADAMAGNQILVVKHDGLVHPAVAESGNIDKDGKVYEGRVWPARLPIVSE